MNKHIQKALKDLNYNQYEIALYLAALELGEASAKNITAKAGTQRTSFYDISKKIIEHGLLREIIRGKRRYFVATSPDDFFENQKEKMSQLEKIMPELRSLYNASGNKPRIYFYEGDAIEKIYEDMTKYEGETIDIFSSPHFFFGRHERRAREIIEKRVENKSKVHLITEMTTETLGLKKSDPESLRETRLLTPDLYHSNIEIGMYANKVYVVDFKEHLGFLIESKEFSHTLRMIFSMIWKSGRIIDK